MTFTLSEMLMNAHTFMKPVMGRVIFNDCFDNSRRIA